MVCLSNGFRICARAPICWYTHNAYYILRTKASEHMEYKGRSRTHYAKREKKWIGDRSEEKRQHQPTHTPLKWLNSKIWTWLLLFQLIWFRVKSRKSNNKKRITSINQIAERSLIGFFSSIIQNRTLKCSFDSKWIYFDCCYFGSFFF